MWRAIDIFVRGEINAFDGEAVASAEVGTEKRTEMPCIQFCGGLQWFNSERSKLVTLRLKVLRNGRFLGRRNS